MYDLKILSKRRLLTSAKCKLWQASRKIKTPTDVKEMLLADANYTSDFAKNKDFLL